MPAIPFLKPSILSLSAFLVILNLLVVDSASGKADEIIPIFRFNPGIYNPILKQEISVKVTFQGNKHDSNLKKLGTFDLCAYEILAEGCEELGVKARAQFRDAILKFKSWEKTALATNDPIQKEVASIASNRASFYKGNDWFFDFHPKKFSVGIFTNSPGKYSMTVEFPKITPSNNQAFAHKPSVIFISSEDASLLAEALREENLKEKVKNFYDNKKAEDEKYK